MGLMTGFREIYVEFKSLHNYTYSEACGQGFKSMKICFLFSERKKSENVWTKYSSSSYKSSKKQMKYMRNKIFISNLGVLRNLTVIQSLNFLRNFLKNIICQETEFQEKCFTVIFNLVS